MTDIPITPYGDCTMTSSPSSSFVLPSLIQRCVVSGELLGYEYMEPSFCFAAGHQREAIKKLVEQGFALYETKVTVNKNTGPSRTVYVIAPLSFDLDAYHKSFSPDIDNPWDVLQRVFQALYPESSLGLAMVP